MLFAKLLPYHRFAGRLGIQTERVSIIFTVIDSGAIVFESVALSSASAAIRTQGTRLTMARPHHVNGTMSLLTLISMFNCLRVFLALSRKLRTWCNCLTESVLDFLPLPVLCVPCVKSKITCRMHMQVHVIVHCLCQHCEQMALCHCWLGAPPFVCIDCH
jgi:hypothetical protein